MTSSNCVKLRRTTATSSDNGDLTSFGPCRSFDDQTVASARVEPCTHGPIPSSHSIPPSRLGLSHRLVPSHSFKLTTFVSYVVQKLNSNLPPLYYSTILQPDILNFQSTRNPSEVPCPRSLGRSHRVVISHSLALKSTY